MTKNNINFVRLHKHLSEETMDFRYLHELPTNRRFQQIYSGTLPEKNSIVQLLLTQSFQRIRNMEENVLALRIPLDLKLPTCQMKILHSNDPCHQQLKF